MSIFVCDICGVTFKFKYEIIVHFKDHLNGSVKNNNRDTKIDSAFKCDVCNRMFSRKETYTNHSLWHSGKSPHRCTVCGKSFTRRIILEKHEKKHSTAGEPSQSKDIKAIYSCDYCTKKFTRKGYLKAHIAIHTQESQHKCEHCEKMFTRKEYLVNHTRIHTGETPFKCERCSKQFMSMKSLKTHLGNQCQESFVCHICSKSFTKKSSMTNHINRAHCTGGEFKCVECEKYFAVNQNLIIHMQSHKI